MKIGMVFPSVEYGGQEKNLITLSNELHKSKYIIEILAYGNNKFTTAKIHYVNLFKFPHSQCIIEFSNRDGFFNSNNS